MAAINVDWEIELDKPSIFVIVTAPIDSDENTLLELAIAEMTRKTFIFRKRIVARYR